MKNLRLTAFSVVLALVFALLLSFSAASARDRSFPSVFAAWISADQLNPEGTGLSRIESADATWARHDLIFTGPTAYGLKFNAPFPGLATGFTPESIAKGRLKRANILRENPNAILLAEIRYRDAPAGYLPPSSPWWMKDKAGARIPGWAEGGYSLLDFADTRFQRQVALQCRAAVKTGVVDGCMFDWWGTEDAARVALIEGVRAAVGSSALILVNVNGNRPVLSAPFINGIYMEGFGAPFFSDWRVASQNLLWARTHLRPPEITAFEGWYPDAGSRGRDELALMRRVTTLSLVFSDGYVLFGDPDSLPVADHGHDWYHFWNRSLGHIAGPPGVARADGSFSREYENGTVIFNPPGNPPVTVQFPSARTSQATGLRSKTAVIASGDGDLLLH